MYPCLCQQTIVYSHHYLEWPNVLRALLCFGHPTTNIIFILNKFELNWIELPDNMTTSPPPNMDQQWHTRQHYHSKILFSLFGAQQIFWWQLAHDAWHNSHICIHGHIVENLVARWWNTSSTLIVTQEANVWFLRGLGDNLGHWLPSVSITK